MSVYFAFVDDRPAFFLSSKAAPKGAVKVSNSRHADLLAAQAEGKTIVRGRGGLPKIVAPKVTIDGRTKTIVRSIRSEASRRIDLVSPQWRQLNDMRTPSSAGDTRFTQIDAIREASEAIERGLLGLTLEQLDTFPVSTHPLWPEFD